MGVAFLAIPILSFGSQDLVRSVQPLALLLNGISGLFAAFAFAGAGHVDWSKAWRLALSMSVAAPLGVLTARQIAPTVIWIMFYLAVAIVVWLLFRRGSSQASFGIAHMVAVSIPVAYLCGVLGVGPGFLMVPVLIAAGLGIRSASGITSVAVVPFSFVAFGMHQLAGARFDTSSATSLSAFTAAGALAGGYLASRVVGDRPLRIIFAASIIGLCVYKSLWLVRTPVPSGTIALLLHKI